MRAVMAVNPFRCRVSELHPRLDAHINEETCKEEIESYVEHGQLVPALGRRLKPGSDHDIEVLCGARRLFLARHLNVPLQIELCELSDRDAIVAMEQENRLRQDTSAYERGVAYVRWLKEGHFASQDEIARALQISPARVSRLVQLAGLPSEVVDAFASTADLCERWGLKLAKAATSNGKRAALVAAAQDVVEISPRPAAREVYTRLCAAMSPDREATSHIAKTVKAPDGKVLFRLKRASDASVVTIPIENLSAELLEQIETGIAQVIEKHRARIRNRHVHPAPRPPRELALIVDDAAPGPLHDGIAQVRI